MGRPRTRINTTNNATETPRPVGRPRRTPLVIQPVEPAEETRSTWLDYLKLGESYTSLILGILVVIIASVLLVSFVKNRNIGKVADTNQQIASQKTVDTTKLHNENSQLQNTTPVAVSNSPAPTATTAPTATKAPTPTVKAATPTAQPTKVAVAATAPKPTSVPVNTMYQGAPKNLPNSYTIAAGDTLWSIAEKFYQSGYNWVDIAKANKLTNSDVISVGTKISLPRVEPKVATVQTTPQSTLTDANAITGTTYTIMKGDNLWNIAVRAYNNGYRWTDIANANPTVNPRVIYAGNVIKIPR